MFIRIRWIDIPTIYKEYLLHEMVSSFEKPWSNTLMNRFNRPSCYVDLYYKENKLIGACFFWKMTRFYYLDKFFILSHRRQSGLGRIMFSEWIEKLPSMIVWRTSSTLSTNFYGKHPSVHTYFQHGDYIYQGTKRHVWEYEDIIELIQLRSAFYH